MLHSHQTHTDQTNQPIQVIRPKGLRREDTDTQSSGTDRAEFWAEQVQREKVFQAGFSTERNVERLLLLSKALAVVDPETAADIAVKLIQAETGMSRASAAGMVAERFIAQGLLLSQSVTTLRSESP